FDFQIFPDKSGHCGQTRGHLTICSISLDSLEKQQIKKIYLLQPWLKLTMKLTHILMLGSCLAVYGNCKTIEVSTADQLHSALSSVTPGDSIHMAAGDYTGTFTATRSGTASAPITLKGPKKAVLSGPKYAFWLRADHWVLRGFSMANSIMGLVLEGASHNLLDDIECYNSRQEGVHFRMNSTDNILQNSYIHDTGKGEGDYYKGRGEGVYIGLSHNNWVDNKVDMSDRNQILNNRIGPGVTAECIDVKEGTNNGVIRGNHFDGTDIKGIHSADSWVDVKGESYTIEDNTGEHSIYDGFQNILNIHFGHGPDNMGSCNNTIVKNVCHGLAKNGTCVRSSTILDNKEMSEWGTSVNTTTVDINTIKLFHVFDDINGYNVFCGNSHTLVVTGDDCVYGWAYKIRGVYCYYDFSFAVTTDGRVFSWGQNNCHLGHNILDNVCSTGDQNNTEISDYKRFYDELCALGLGCFGTVFKIKHKGSGNEYAIKIIDNINCK
ncbi:unnamed protein product, partial [Medioppia subpectinata]